MTEPNAELLMQQFENSKYPTLEQTIEANRTAQYKHKKEFLKELKHSFHFLGFLLIALSYFKDGAGFRFVILCFLQYTISNPIPSQMVALYSEEHQTRVVKNIMHGIFVFFLVSVFVHLVSSTRKEGDDFTEYFHGGMLIYFIGEKWGTSKFELIVYDILIFFTQSILHVLVSFTDDSEVLKVEAREQGDYGAYQEVPDDGSNGNVFLVEVKVFETIFKNIL